MVHFITQNVHGAGKRCFASSRHKEQIQFFLLYTNQHYLKCTMSYTLQLYFQHVLQLKEKSTELAENDTSLPTRIATTPMAISRQKSFETPFYNVVIVDENAIMPTTKLLKQQKRRRRRQEKREQKLAEQAAAKLWYSSSSEEEEQLLKPRLSKISFAATSPTKIIQNFQDEIQKPLENMCLQPDSWHSSFTSTTASLGDSTSSLFSIDNDDETASAATAGSQPQSTITKPSKTAPSSTVLNAADFSPMSPRSERWSSSRPRISRNTSDSALPYPKRILTSPQQVSKNVLTLQNAKEW